MRTASASSDSFSVSAGKGVPVLWIAMPPSRPSRSVELVAPLLGHNAQNSYGFSGDFGTDTVTGKHKNVQIQELVSNVGKSRCECLLAAARQFGDLRIHQTLLIVREGGQLRVNEVELLFRQVKPQPLKRELRACRPLCLPNTRRLSGTPTDFGSMISYVVRSLR